MDPHNYLYSDSHYESTRISVYVDTIIDTQAVIIEYDSSVDRQSVVTNLNHTPFPSSANTSGVTMRLSLLEDVQQGWDE